MMKLNRLNSHRPLAQSTVAKAASNGGVLWLSAVWHFQDNSFFSPVGIALTSGGSFDENHEQNLVDLIKDLRAEFKNPKLPVSITTTSMVPPPERTAVELGQIAVADPKKHPEFAGTVKTTGARPFWHDASVSPGNFGCHWNHHGVSEYLNGKAMGEKMVQMPGGP